MQRGEVLGILATLLAAPGRAPAADASPAFPAPIIPAARVIKDDNAGTICSAKDKSVTLSTRSGPSRRGDLLRPQRIWMLF